MQSATASLPRTRNGYYVGTRKRAPRQWWRSGYRGFGWLTRGNGEVWLERDALCFRLFLTGAVRRIPLGEVLEVAVDEGRWHMGRWTGALALRITWRDDAQELVTKFCVGGFDGTTAWAAALQSLLPGR